MKTSTFEKLTENKQIAILDAAARIFAEKGYFQAGIVEICQAAEISNGALYKYFENKKGLFIAVAHRTMALVLEVSTQNINRKMGFWDRLRSILEEVHPFLSKYRDYFIVYMDLGAPFMDEFASELSDKFEQHSLAFYNQIIENARNKCEIRKGISTESAAYYIDNHIMLFSFSCVSEHHNRRFHQYFGKGSGNLETEKKIDWIMRSFREFLG